MIRTIKISIIVIICVVLISISYYLISPAFNDIEKNETFPEYNSTITNQQNQTRTTPTTITRQMPSTPTILIQAEFQAQAHEVQGRALLLQTQDQKILRFEDFETINGPELHIYLSRDLTNNDFIDLGEIKATKGNVNYELPPETDTSKYSNVLVWCKPFGVLFSYAQLQK